MGTPILLLGLLALFVLFSLGRTLWSGAVLRPFLDIRRAKSPRIYWALVVAHLAVFVALGLGVTALVRTIRSTEFSAEVECTALPSGQVRDCVVISQTDPGAGHWAIEDVSRDCFAPIGPVDPTDPTTVRCTNGHPGYDKPLPRRFRATRSMIVY